jgi:hypothetical protein
MFLVEEIIDARIVYFFQTDFYKRIFSCLFIVFILFDLLPAQIPEIELVQLGPGLYFFLLFICLVCIIYLSNLFLQLPLELSAINSLGIKEKPKPLANILYKIVLVYLFLILLCVLNSLIPLSLDGFIESLENPLEDAWSLTDVIFFESFLLLILIGIAEFPVNFITDFYTEVEINKLLPYWKLIIMLSLVFAGFITPTLDGYTQIIFSLSTYLFYLILVSTLKKRLLVKNSSFLVLG